MSRSYLFRYIPYHIYLFHWKRNFTWLDTVRFLIKLLLKDLYNSINALLKIIGYFLLKYFESYLNLFRFFNLLFFRSSFSLKGWRCHHFLYLTLLLRSFIASISSFINSFFRRRLRDCLLLFLFLALNHIDFFYRIIYTFWLIFRKDHWLCFFLISFYYAAEHTFKQAFTFIQHSIVIFFCRSYLWASLYILRWRRLRLYLYSRFIPNVSILLKKILHNFW